MRFLTSGLSSKPPDQMLNFFWIKILIGQDIQIRRSFCIRKEWAKSFFFQLEQTMNLLPVGIRSSYWSTYCTVFWIGVTLKTQSSIAKNEIVHIPRLRNLNLRVFKLYRAWNCAFLSKREWGKLLNIYIQHTCRVRRMCGKKSHVRRMNQAHWQFLKNETVQSICRLQG